MDLTQEIPPMQPARTRRPLALCFLAWVLMATLSTAQRSREEGNRPARDEARRELGQYLFESPLLSANRRVSCATCHDPARSFTDQLPQSKGGLELAVGRNSPTLFGIGTLPRFPDPASLPKALSKQRAAGGGGVSFLDTIDLDTRCLSPIENPLEMGSSLEDVIAVLKKTKAVRYRFRKAFNSTDITPARVAASLGTFVRSLGQPDAPYAAFLAGDHASLSDTELRGRAIFSGPGRCDACHTGTALTDGLVHQVVHPKSWRAEAHRTRQSQLQQELAGLIGNEFGCEPPPQPKTPRSSGITPSPTFQRDMLTALARTGGASRYGGQTSTPRAQRTPTLWDVSRTAPYFAEGSVTHLETAVKQHILELRELHADTKTFHTLSTEADEPLLKTPQKLLPTWARTGTPPTPELLREAEVQDLLAYLRSLSPRATTAPVIAQQER